MLNSTRNIYTVKGKNSNVMCLRAYSQSICQTKLEDRGILALCQSKFFRIMF